MENTETDIVVVTEIKKKPRFIKYVSYYIILYTGVIGQAHRASKVVANFIPKLWENRITDYSYKSEG